MNKLSFLLLFVPLISFGQSWGFGIGTEVSNKFRQAYKFSIERISYPKRSKIQSFGLEIGLATYNESSCWDCNDIIYTDEVTYAPYIAALKYSRHFKNRLSFSLAIGNNNAEEVKTGIIDYGYGPVRAEVFTTNLKPFLYYRVGFDYYFSFPMSAQIGFGSNGTFLGLSFVTKHRNLLKTIDEKNKKTQSKRINIGGTRLSEVNLFDLRAMIEIFIKDCKENGIIIKQNNIKSSYENLSQGLVALAYGMNNDNEILIKVDPIQWESSSPSKKWYVLYHELGHDILNLDHGEGGKMMYNYVDRDYSWDEWLEDKNYMFESYKKFK
tara:strand:- start:321 stop:1292 length:972 start_codon:yes stop_codon:yes gene_type:complete